MSAPTKQNHDALLGCLIGIALLLIFALILYSAVRFFGFILDGAKAIDVEKAIDVDMPWVSETDLRALSSYSCQLSTPVFDSVITSRRLGFDRDEAERRARQWIAHFPEVMRDFPTRMRHYGFNGAQNRTIDEIAETRSLAFLNELYLDTNLRFGDSEALRASRIARSACLNEVREKILTKVRVRD